MKYGEKIVLFANYDLNEPGKEIKEHTLENLKFHGNRLSGFLSAKGFLDKSISFQTIKGEVESEINKSIKMPNVTNRRDFVFVVTPKLKFDSQNDYEVAFKEFKKLQQGFKNLDERRKKNKQKQLE